MPTTIAQAAPSQQARREVVMLAESETLGAGLAPGQPRPPEQTIIKQAPDLLGPDTASESQAHLPYAIRDQPKAADAAANAAHPAPHGAPITLETLPAELRLQIIRCVSDLADLKAMVHASPVFHQQYLLDRRQLLGNHLQASLGRVLVDAYALQQSRALPEAHRLPLGATTRFVRLQLADYAELRGNPDGVLGRCSLDDLASMASFYLSVIRPLLAHLPALLLRNLGGPPEMEVEELSKVERTRLSRALYRVQLFYSLFRFDEADGLARLQLLATDKILEFFGLFEPWENEEVHAVYQAMVDKYQPVFDDEISWDPDDIVDGQTPRVPREPNAFDLENYARQQLREGTIANGGLGLFRRALAASSYDELVILLHANMSCCTVDTIAHLMSEWEQDIAREAEPSERDEAEYRGDALLFMGDVEDGPPLAWVTSWKGVYSNTYGGLTPLPLRRFGYVFWDAGRLLKTGGMKRVEAHNG